MKTTINKKNGKMIVNVVDYTLEEVMEERQLRVRILEETTLWSFLKFKLRRLCK